MSVKSTVLFAALAIAVLFAVHFANKILQIELSRPRFFAVQAAIQNTPNPVVIFGDSIVERAVLPPQVCGFALVNAGVAGAKISYFQRHSAELLGYSRPKLTVLAVGINDAAAKDDKDFQGRYHQTVSSLVEVAPVLVATVTPVQEGPFASIGGYDPQMVPALNRAISATPNATAVIDLNGPLSEANLTTDGVHLSAAGYSLWTGAIVKGIAAALGCIQQ